MDIVFYVNESENNKIGKTLTSSYTSTGTFRENVDVMNPSFLVAFDPTQYNYCRIETFNRYYYIDRIENIRTGIWRVYCSVDVLQSFEDAILALDCIIDKQQVVKNNYLDDGSWVNENRVFNTIINFSSGFLDNPEFILITAGST